MRRALSNKTFIILGIFFAILQALDIGLTMYGINLYGTTDIELNPIVRHNIVNGRLWLIMTFKLLLLPVAYIYSWKVMFQKLSHKSNVNLIYGSAYIGVNIMMLWVIGMWVVKLVNY